MKTADILNTMTIGWGNVGYIWGIPVFTVVVRKSRYTYTLIEDTDQFTISIPFTEYFSDELTFCGTKSGRDFDKFKECNLTAVPGKKVATPVIKGCSLHYECRIRFKQAMAQEQLNDNIREKWYPDNDYHTFYYGEIVACYVEENFSE